MTIIGKTQVARQKNSFWICFSKNSEELVEPREEEFIFLKKAT